MRTPASSPGNALPTAASAPFTVPLPSALLADAHALLAKADLPATPVLVRLAAVAAASERSELSGTLARMPVEVRRLLPQLPAAQAQQVESALAAVPAPADLGDGPLAAERALRHAGVVPPPDPADPPPTRLVRALADLAVALQEAEATVPTEHPHKSGAVDAVVGTVREVLAPEVFKPKDLTDYDRIIPLPLLANGQPLPARIAIATRTGGGGERATWVRIDAELSHLGPVSVRLSGGAGGPVAITLVADPAAAGILGGSLPDLAEDLRRRHILAVLRVATPAEIDHG